MIEALLKQIKLDTSIWMSEIHGLDHWKRVEENALMLAQVTGADTNVVSYFAYLHDSQRLNEDEDPEHGPRAAAYAARNRSLIDLTEVQFRLLQDACTEHTYAMPSEYSKADPTLATCWDADRLDIGRVGLEPEARYLFTDFAKEFIDD